MNKPTLYLFPDTNLFIQCRPLADVDWSEWNGFEVHLIVCRPVQREIDDLKNRRNDRVSRRARATSSIFKQIITSKSDYKLVRKADPQVRLYLQGASQPSKELEGKLNYNKTDDEIIGYLHKYKQDNPDADARLLTHDAGPMMTAESLKIQFYPIKNEWIMPPENNESEKEIAQLKSQVERFEKSEPQFNLQFEGARGLKLGSIEYTKFEPLTSDEISSCIHSLKERFPPAQDFGPQEDDEDEEQPTGIARIFAMKRVFIPASDEDIRDYKDKQYPDWLKACEDMLSTLHEVLQKGVGQPGFTIIAENVGSRPGRDSLIEIEAKGNFTIRPSEGDGDSTDQAKQRLKLPLPPSPPRGKWVSAMSLNIPLDNPFDNVPPDGENFSLLPSLPDNSHRDPDKFYFKPGRPNAPTKLFRLECERWRHGIGAARFNTEIIVDPDAEEIQGTIECRIHAGNLTNSVRESIPVRGSVVRVSAADCAHSLVRDLLERGKQSNVL